MKILVSVRVAKSLRNRREAVASPLRCRCAPGPIPIPPLPGFRPRNPVNLQIPLSNSAPADLFRSIFSALAYRFLAAFSATATCSSVWSSAQRCLHGCNLQLGFWSSLTQHSLCGFFDIFPAAATCSSAFKTLLHSAFFASCSSLLSPAAIYGSLAKVSLHCSYS